MIFKLVLMVVFMLLFPEINQADDSDIGMISQRVMMSQKKDKGTDRRDIISKMSTSMGTSNASSMPIIIKIKTTETMTLNNFTSPTNSHLSGPLGFRVEYLEASPVLLNAYVKWKKPTGEVEVMAYIISYFINGSNAAMVNVSYNTHFFITDLQPSSVVSDITVYATNKTGPCEPTTLSNKVNIMPSLSIVPDVEAFAISSTSILVSWTSLDDPNVTSYVVLYRLKDSKDGRTEVDPSNSVGTNTADHGALRVPTNKTTVIISDLLKDQTYLVLVAPEVFLEKTVLTGPLSDPVTVTTTFPKVLVIPGESIATEIVPIARNNPTYVAVAVVIPIATVILSIVVLLVGGILWYWYGGPKGKRRVSVDEPEEELDGNRPGIDERGEDDGVAREHPTHTNSQEPQRSDEDNEIQERTMSFHDTVFSGGTPTQESAPLPVPSQTDES